MITKRLNLIFIILLLARAISISCMDEQIELEVLEKKENQETACELITLVSLDGKEFDIEKKVAFQSKLIKKTYESNSCSKLELQTEANILDSFINALYCSDISISDGDTLQEIYQSINRELISISDDKFLVFLLEEAIYLDCPVLKHSIAYEFAKRFYYFKESDVMEIVKLINNPGILALIAQQYILQFKELINFKRHKNDDEFNNEIYSRVNNSIFDLADYNCIKIVNKQYVETARTSGGDSVPEKFYKIDVYLDLSNTKISSLAGLDKIPGIENVTHLNLIGNNIVKIGDEIKACTNLKILVLYGNKIEDINPEALKRLPKLKKIYYNFYQDKYPNETNFGQLNERCNDVLKQLIDLCDLKNKIAIVNYEQYDDYIDYLRISYSVQNKEFACIIPGDRLSYKYRMECAERDLNKDLK